MNNKNSYPALRALFILIFLSSLVIGFETKVFNNPSKLSLLKRISTFFSAFFCLN